MQKRDLAAYYHWEETDRGIRIYLQSGMADRLQAEIPDDAEVGGILLGHAEEEQGKAVIYIEDFAPVPCSHGDGPLYQLDEQDVAKMESVLLRQALAGCGSPDAPSIIGYYRSQMGEGLSLSAGDLELIHSYFETPSSVFLVIKAAAGSKACTAGFFFWEDGRIQSEFSSLEIALGRTGQGAPVSEFPEALSDEALMDPEDGLTDGLPDDLAKLFREAAEPQPAEVLKLAKPSVTAWPVWRGLLFRVATILIATAALVVSVITYLGAPRPVHEEAAAPAPAISTLGLQVETSPPDLLVTWSRNAREIVEARRGTLFIRDGKAQHNVNLDSVQLRRGSYLYLAATENIQLRLEVYGPDDGSVSQSIRLRGERVARRN